MRRSAKIDWLPHYRAVLVATALIATREAPAAVEPRSPMRDDGNWAGTTFDASGWRAVAIAAGAVSRS